MTEVMHPKWVVTAFTCITNIPKEAERNDFRFTDTNIQGPYVWAVMLNMRIVQIDHAHECDPHLRFRSDKDVERVKWS